MNVIFTRIVALNKLTGTRTKFKFLLVVVLSVLIFLSTWKWGTREPSCFNIFTDNIQQRASNDDQFIKLESECGCRRNAVYYVSTTDIQNKLFSCGLYNTFRRGYAQKIVSYSLYGSNPIYYSEIGRLSKQVAKQYPGWTIRIYYDRTVNSSLKCDLECLKDEETGLYMDNIDFCDIHRIPYGGNQVKTWSAEYMHSMKWRFLPIGDPFVDMFMSRDLDSWIIDREVQAVKVWMNSNTLFHVMRDNPQHNVPILGGMWSYANYRNRKIGTRVFFMLIDKAISNDYNEDTKSSKGKDQDFLGAYVWPIAKENATVHDSYFCHSYGGAKASAFPTQRPIVFCFVPCAYCCDETVNNQTWTHQCPTECRPEKHKDWLYC